MTEWFRCGGRPRMVWNPTDSALGAVGFVREIRSDLVFVVGFLVTFCPYKKWQKKSLSLLS